MGKAIGLITLGMVVAAGASSQDAAVRHITLKEAMAIGTSVEVLNTVNLTGRLSEPNSNAKQSQPAAIWASGNSRYRERVLDVSEQGEVTQTARRYLSASLEKNRGETKQEIQLRSTVERILVQRANEQSTLFSPDGPLTGMELDLLRAEPFAPALQGLLPANATKIGETWQATAAAASELTGVEPIQSGALNCVFREVKTGESGAIARVNFAGTLVGPTDQGPTRMNVEGHLLFDLDQHLISYLIMNGRSELLDSAGRAVGKIDGRYELTRRPAIDDPRINDSALKSVNLKPGPEVTALLFDAPQIGIRFRYPRNWDLAATTKNVVQLDEPTGGTIRLTLDTQPAPSAEKLRTDLLSWLKMQKATVNQTGSIEPHSLGDSRSAQRFSVRAQHEQKQKEWTYLVLVEGDRSATIACNMLQDRSDAIRGDVEFIAQSIEFLIKQPGSKD